MSSKYDKYERYLNTYSGRELLTKYSLNETGTWKILGEDPNCDLGGHHGKPELGLYEGKLGDIIRYGVELMGFWQWGYGGEFIKLAAPVKIDTDVIRRKAELEKRAAELEEELKAIRLQLKG